MKKVSTSVLGLALIAAGQPALAQSAASDSADDPIYAFGWAELLNGGTGFEPWEFASSSENGDGFAGFFLADSSVGGLSNIATGPNGNAWSVFANGGSGRELASAFRGFDSPAAAGDAFSVSMEHGFIADGGLVGFSLRAGNATDNAGDYGIGSRMQFFFQGGQGNYLVVDGDGVLDTGIPFTLDGMRVKVLFTGADTYILEVARFADEIGSTRSYLFPERSLAGTGAVESVALFNDDGGAADGLNNDIYFNSLRIGTPPEIGTVLDLNRDGTVDFLDVLEFLNALDAVSP